MASTLTRSLRRLTGASTGPEYSPLLEETRNGTRETRRRAGDDDEDHLETSLLAQNRVVENYGAADDGGVYAQVHRQHLAPSTQLPANVSDNTSTGTPVPIPRRRRRNPKYDTLRACHSAGLTQAEFMERSRYARVGDNGGPAAYDEDLYAPIGTLQRNAVERSNGEGIYESVQQHERILENVCLQPWPLAERKQYRKLLRSSLQERIGQLDGFDSKKHSGQKAVSYASKKLSGYTTSHGFLSSWIKKVEGQFGTGVASFFIFLRSLFFLNLLTTVFAFAFLVIPQIAFGSGNTNVNSGDALDAIYNSPVFYGYYDNNTGLNSSYNLPMAYLTVNLALFLLCFLSIAYVMRRRYRTTKRTTVERVDSPFSVKVFTFWDYTITDFDTARLTSASIGTGFREELREIKEAMRRSQISIWLVVLLRLVANLLVVALLGGSGFLVYLFVRRYQDRTEFSSNGFMALVQQFELPFILAALRLIGPLLFGYLVKLEKYHPRTAFKWTMLRTLVLYLGNLAVLTVTLLLKASRMQDCDESNGGDTPTTSPPSSTIPSSGQPRDQCCWESLVGEELLKVILIDFAAILLAVVFADVLREVVTRRSRVIREKIGRGEFQVAVNVLDMIYGQGLVWIGTFYSPILPAFALVKTGLLFFFYYYTTMFSHAAPKKIFRASRSGNFLLFVLLIDLFLCLMPILYVLSRLPPSANCGPFRMYTNSFEVITEHFSLSVQDGVSLIGTPVILVPLLVICCAVILYYRMLATSYREIIKDIRTQLHFEMPDKTSGDSTSGRASAVPALSPAHTEVTVRQQTNQHTTTNVSRPGSTSTQLTHVSAGVSAGSSCTRQTSVESQVSTVTNTSTSSKSTAAVASPHTQSRENRVYRASSIVDEPLPQPPV